MATEEKKASIEKKGRIREAVFGIQDGLVSTVAFVTGLYSATSDNQWVLLGGLVQMLAGAISMAAGAYLSTKAEIGVYQKEIDKERERISKEPYLASEELLEALTQEGLSREKAYRVVQMIQDEEKSWLKTFQEKVLGLGEINTQMPIGAALIIGLYFVLGAAIPLTPYLIFSEMTALWGSVLLSGVALFGVGVAKAVFGKGSWWRSGLEFLIVAAGAAAVGYLFGLLLPTPHIIGA